MFKSRLSLTSRLPGVYAVTMLLLFPNVILAAHAGSSLDATLNRDLYLIEKYSSASSHANPELLSAYNLSDDPAQYLSVFLYYDEPPSDIVKYKLENRGVTLYPKSWLPHAGAHKQGFLLANVPANALKGLLYDGLAVRAAAGYRKLYPTNDLTAEETGVVEGREQNPPLRGSGVRLAVLDSGFQLEHDDLPRPEGTMDYADYPDTSEDVTDMISGHGTHVAGTVFGSGELSDGRWMGMAPDCDPIYLKIGNDTSAHASTEATVAAIRGASAVFEADIATMSYGGFDGFDDGSSPEAQAVDWAVGQGTTFFVSAGNYGLTRTHYYGTVAANSATNLIRIAIRVAPPRSYWELYLTWFDDADTSVHVPLSAVIYKVNQEDTLDYEQLDRISSVRGTELLHLVPNEPMPEDSSTYFVRVTNHSDQAQDFHLRTISSHFYVRFWGYSSAYTVLSPSTADSCISVGAYTSRTSWTDYWGDFHDDHTIRGEIADFSSMGPRIDGLLKPDITAPGRRTISCRDSDIIRLGEDHGLDYLIISNDGESGEPADYLAFMGTSMSSPAAAGTAALILEANPEMSSAELRRVIRATAKVDTFTADVPNSTWGWGKIDLMSALFVNPDLFDDPSYPKAISINSIYPNPFNRSTSVEFELQRSGLVRFILLDTMGRRVWDTQESFRNGTHSLSLNTELSGIPSGEYLLKVGNSNGWDFGRITLVK